MAEDLTYRDVEKVLDQLDGEFYTVGAARVFPKLGTTTGSIMAGCVVIPMISGNYPDGACEGEKFTQDVQKWKMGLTRMVEFHPLCGETPESVVAKITHARRELEDFNG